MEKTKKLQLEDFTENEFFGTQEQQYLKAQVREELKEQRPCSIITWMNC
ncbi:hypothetical protein [Streptococcus suis]|uniref:Uncharacterized protein n=1 Tax=Streptococcus suis TaxID=1307 RepID=A0A6G6AX01_STRSU|nr:hypothetical protein [Streptococcus suis]MBL6504862.1 hypothetical protein [Streptococcus suis]MBM0242630.1 hypothetical protein [Streptococcus suis]MBM7205548.1 hypothetical protein [Streptococcus suis]MBM7282930.1 hypothetical protein [Streptococcus suis]MBO4136430.1 hypothetical protein [Streptococcus suis]